MSPRACAHVSNQCPVSNTSARLRAAQVALRRLLAQVALRRLLCASSLRKMFCARFSAQVLCTSSSAQVALRKCPVQVSVSSDFAARAAGRYSAYYFCTYKLRFLSRSCETAPRVLLLYLKVAIFEPELRNCTSRTTFVPKSCDFGAVPRVLLFVPKSCDFGAEASGLYLAYYVCT